MTLRLDDEYTAFAGRRHLATGPLLDVARQAKEMWDQDTGELVFIFHNESGHVLEIDFRGTVDYVLARLERQYGSKPTPAPEAEPEPKLGPTPKPEPKPGPTPKPKRPGPGRPRLGVVGREVTLLPRHWEWLDAQPSGASAALRKLVETAMREGRDAERARRLRDGAYRFISFMAGDFPNFEEASRALFAQDYDRFRSLVASWPADVRDHLLKLVDRVIEAEAKAGGGDADGRD